MFRTFAIIIIIFIIIRELSDLICRKMWPIKRFLCVCLCVYVYVCYIKEYLSNVEGIHEKSEFRACCWYFTNGRLKPTQMHIACPWKKSIHLYLPYMYIYWNNWMYIIIGGEIYLHKYRYRKACVCVCALYNVKNTLVNILTNSLHGNILLPLNLVKRVNCTG